MLQQGLIGHVFLLLCALALKPWGVWALQPRRVLLHTSLWCVPAFSFAVHPCSAPSCEENAAWTFCLIIPYFSLFDGLFFPIYFLFNDFSTSSFLEQIHGLYIIEFIETNKELIIPGGQPSKVRINVQIWTIGLRSYHADLILLLYLENVGYLYPLLAASWPLLWACHPFIWKIYVPWLVREADVQ